MKQFLWPSVLILVIVVLDQLTKHWAVGALATEGSREVLGNFLRFTLVYNVGGAMGTALGPSTFYLLISAIILPILLFYLYQYRNDPFFSWPLASIVAGAIGNAIDRIQIGKVVDFIDVDFFKINVGSFHLDRWWTFNIADAAISCALVFLVIRLLFHHPKKAEAPVGNSTETV